MNFKTPALSPSVPSSSCRCSAWTWRQVDWTEPALLADPLSQWQGVKLLGITQTNAGKTMKERWSKSNKTRKYWEGHWQRGLTVLLTLKIRPKSVVSPWSSAAPVAFWNNQMWPAERSKATNFCRDCDSSHLEWPNTSGRFLDCSLAEGKSELVRMMMRMMMTMQWQLMMMMMMMMKIRFLWKSELVWGCGCGREEDDDEEEEDEEEEDEEDDDDNAMTTEVFLHSRSMVWATQKQRISLRPDESLTCWFQGSRTSVV